MKWLPNVLSAFRLIVGFPILYLTIKGEWLAALILIICGFLSDLIDGPLARKFKAETRIGETLDILADIAMDELIIMGLFLASQISWQLAVLFAPIIIILRLPVIFSSQTFLFKLGFFVLPVYSCCMIWLIVSIYALKALGGQILCYAIVLAALVAPVIIWLKRERIKTDLKKFKTAFLQRR